MILVADSLQVVLAQSVRNTGQNKATFWRGTQQRGNLPSRIQPDSGREAALQNGSPGVFQQPFSSKPALTGTKSDLTPDSAKAEQGHPQQAESLRDQQAERQAARQTRPQNHQADASVLSPAANRFFRNLEGPNLSTWNQNRNHYSFSRQTRPDTRIPRITWQSGSRFGQTTSRRSFHNQTTFNQNRHNYSLRSITSPGFRGYR